MSSAFQSISSPNFAKIRPTIFAESRHKCQTNPGQRSVLLRVTEAMRYLEVRHITIVIQLRLPETTSIKEKNDEPLNI